MSLLEFFLIVVVILALLGLGWKNFSYEISIDYDKVVDIGTTVIRNGVRS